MEFNKYRDLGAYHWKEWEKKTIYGQHAEKVASWVNEPTVLDIGAGDGLITYLLNKKPDIRCIGIDDNRLAVNLAKEKKSLVFHGDAYNIPFGDNMFSAVLMADVIEHFETPDIAIEEAKRVLKKGGYFYITTPPAMKNGLHDKYHYREYTPQQLTTYITNFGFSMVEPVETKFVRMYGKFIL